MDGSCYDLCCYFLFGLEDLIDKNHGTREPVEISLILMKDVKDNSIGFRGIMSDMTNRHRKFIHEISKIRAKMPDDNLPSGWTIVFVAFGILYAMAVARNFIVCNEAILASAEINVPESVPWRHPDCWRHG